MILLVFPLSLKGAVDTETVIAESYTAESVVYKRQVFLDNNGQIANEIDGDLLVQCDAIYRLDFWNLGSLSTDPLHAQSRLYAVFTPTETLQDIMMERMTQQFLAIDPMTMNPKDAALMAEYRWIQEVRARKPNHAPIELDYGILEFSGSPDGIFTGAVGIQPISGVIRIEPGDRLEDPPVFFCDLTGAYDLTLQIIQQTPFMEWSEEISTVVTKKWADMHRTLVLAVAGDARIRPADAEFAEKAKAGQPLFNQYSIETGPSSYAKMKIGESMLIMNAQTQLLLTDTEDDESFALSIQSGSIWLSKKDTQFDSTMDILTNVGIINVKNATLVCESQDISSTVKVMEGSVRLQSKNLEAIWVTEGKFSETTASGVGALRSFSINEEHQKWQAMLNLLNVPEEQEWIFAIAAIMAAVIMIVLHLVFNRKKPNK
jgi:hypothetical protein